MISELTPPNPHNDYATTHLFAEYYLQQFKNTHNFNSVIFRLTNSYGVPRDINTDKWYLILNDLVKSAYENNEIILKSNGLSQRDFIWMGDICYILEKSFDFTNNSNNIYNLSSGIIYSILDLARKVQKVFQNRYGKNIKITINKDDQTKFSPLSICNNKVQSLINYKFKDKVNDEINNIFKLLEKR